MNTSTYEIQDGMEVFGSDGEKVGKVSRIFSGAPLEAGEPSSGSPGVDRTPTGQPGEYNPNESASAGITSVVDVGRVDRTETVPGYGTVSGTVTGGTDVNNTSGAPVGALGIEETADSGTGGVALTPSDTKYLEVQHGGILGVGGQHLYVPFRAIQAVTPGESLSLKCSAEEAATLYTAQPDDLPGEPPA